MNFASPFSLSLWAITGLSILGLPIGHSMIAGSILYLLLAGQDMGIAAEQLLNGLYNSWVLLAVPLFLLSAELMNVGSMSDRLLRFCDALVGRFRGGLGHINIVQSIIFAGMSGSAIADLAGTGRVMIDMMTRDGKYTRSYAAAITAASAVIGPIIPPSIPMVLFALGVRRLDRLPVHGRRHPRPADGAGADDHQRDHGQAAQLPGREADPAARMAAHHRRGVSRPDDAGDPAGRHLQRHHHADRGGGGGRGLRLRDLGLALSQRHAGRRLQVVPHQRALDGLDRHADRRRPGVQLRDHGREHPGHGARPSWTASSSRRPCSGSWST